MGALGPLERADATDPLRDRARHTSTIVLRDPIDPLGSFWIGRNPSSQRLPYLLRLPVSGEGRIYLASGENWPRSRDVFCYQVDEWPAEAQILEEIPVEGCWRVGNAVHLVLRRRVARRSLFIWTKKADRTLVFWRSPASMRQARPGIRVPQARRFGAPLSLAVDVGERYPWRFVRQRATTVRRRLPVGDYAIVREDVLVAVVERKTPSDLATSATAGRLGLLLADLEQARHAALVVEGRLSDAVKAAERGGVRTGWLIDVVAALQASHPKVCWMFGETRPLAEDWAYRWLAACMDADAPHAMPLLDERAIAEPDLRDAKPGPRLLDAAARRAALLRDAQAGRPWTSRTAAERCGVTQTTAAGDLAALVREGRLEVQGRGRSRAYRFPPVEDGHSPASVPLVARPQED
jgi:hypothetical protein